MWKIKWLGIDTQKNDPIDISIGNYGFSLKEESFILKNMGFYQLLNNLTGSSFGRGLHVFETFASDEYDKWFNYTWKALVAYLQEKNVWSFEKNGNVSKATIKDDSIILSFGENISIVPIDIHTNQQYIAYTNPKTREKVFAKWINNCFSDDLEYIRLKKLCAEIAGKKVSDKINLEYKPDYVYDFLQIYSNEYYYAKVTSSEITILKVPAKNDFNKVIEFQCCNYAVPNSQLNIITTFRNKQTGKLLQFRNECRFSHGQFNGTPEAKMYVSKKTSLTDLYDPI